MVITMVAPIIHRQPPRGVCSMQRGLSLTELLVTTCLAATLASLAIPAMSDMLATQRRIGAVNNLMSSLHLARGEAIKRNGRTVLCKSADSVQCTSLGHWDQGWIVFHDRNNNAMRDVDEALVLHQGPLGERMRLSGNQPVARYVSYGANGTARMVSGAFQAGTFTLCASDGSQHDVRTIILSGTGRPRTARGSAADCP
jgi:type IV fimbrial biogenesis protein FimT